MEKSIVDTSRMGSERIIRDLVREIVKVVNSVTEGSGLAGMILQSLGKQRNSSSPAEIPPAQQSNQDHRVDYA